MEFENFLNRLLEGVMSKSGMDKVKECIKEEMTSSGFNYDNTKVEFQVLDNKNNYDPRVEISNEGYSDGEIIFIDSYLD